MSAIPGAKASDKIGDTEFNNLFLNIIPNLWSKQAYVQVFYCEYITFEKAVNMFEHMEIPETIYEGVV